MSIGRQIVILFLAITLLSLGLFTRYAYLTSLEREQALVRQSVLVQAELLATLLPDSQPERVREAIQRTGLATNSRVRVYSEEGSLQYDSWSGAPVVRIAEGAPVADPPRNAPTVSLKRVDLLEFSTRRVRPENPIPGEPETILTLFVTVPSTDGRFVQIERSLLDLEMMAHELKFRSLLSAMGGAVLVLCFGYAISRWISEPLDRLVEFAESVSRDRDTPELEEQGAPEIKRLSRSVKGMAERLETKERLLKQFVADASHELKTPLTSIRAVAEALTAGASTDPKLGPRFLKNLTKEVSRLEGLVESLLTLQRLESGLVLERSDFDLGELVEEVVGDTATAEVPPQGPRVNGDVSLVRQVLLNLLENARRATEDEERPSVHVSVRAVGVVEVRDNGKGIAAGDLERVFERFFRADTNRARSGGGNGLGLAICKAIVEAHGGRIWVVSEPGQGSSFYFSSGCAAICDTNRSEGA